MVENLLIIDIETDSLNTRSAHILELGVASLDLGSGKIDLLIDTFVRPDCSENSWNQCWYMNNSGVSAEDIRDAPDFNVIRPQLENELKYPATAYNNEFDFSILAQHGIKILQPWPCLMRTCTPILKLPGKYGDYKFPKFIEAWHHFFPHERLVDAHRAGADAINEARLAFELYRGGYLKGLE